MEGGIADLVKIRFERAKEMLGASQVNFDQGELKTSLNRSYYAIFHAMRSVNLISGFDSSKHSGVIAHFNQHYLKTQELDPSLSDIIKKASYCREKSDYDDFYLVSKEEAKEQIESAKLFLDRVEDYLRNTKHLR